MEVRAYCHPFKHIDCSDLEAIDDTRLGRAPLLSLYHMAADLDDQARAVERDVSTLGYATQVREELIALLEALGLYPERLAELQDLQRIEQHNGALGRRMQREYERQQSRVQVAISRKDPRHYVTDMC